MNLKKDMTPKAMLVIDMPESCTKCPLFNNHYTDMNCGGLHNRGINYPVPDNHRMEWCPLLPVKINDIK